jgi:ERCC4-type nuclease
MEILNWILILAILVCFLVMLYATRDTLETSKIFRDFVARRIEEESRSSFEKKKSNDTNTNIKT